MSIPVKLPDDLVNEAKRYAKLQHRSVPMQLEHWARIGKIAEDNPDLSYDFIEQILEAQEQETVPYEFGFDGDDRPVKKKKRHDSRSEA